MQESKISKFFTRLFSGVFLLLIAFYALYIGDSFLLFSLSVTSVVGLFELYRAIGISNSYFAYLNYFISFMYYLLIYNSNGRTILMLIILGLMTNLFYYVISYPKYKIIEVALAIFGFFYVTVLFSFIYFVREYKIYGKYYIWLMLISSWGADTCAYCIGMLFGKNKLSKILSPHKSIEGAIGGIVGAGLLGFLYGLIVDKNTTNLDISIPLCIFVCLICSIVSQLGDLVASAIKRDFNLKDYSDLIPGHGGILDRFDSIIFTAPAIYCIILVFYYIN